MFQLTHPVWGATAISSAGKAVTLKFQSTHPVWGATHYGLQLLKLKIISIHAPRVGCDRGRVTRAKAFL